MAAPSAADWSVSWWCRRHDEGYFPTMEQHKDWRVYDEPPGFLVALAGLRPDDTALEIGCGYGQWMVPVSRHVRCVVGVDVHPTLAAKALEKFAEYSVDNAAVLVTDGKTLPVEDGQFSLVYSISVFQHMPREVVRGYFAEAARVLRPDGRALFHFRHADGDGPYADDIGVDHDRTGKDFSVGWTVEEAVAEARRVGWTAKVETGGNTLLLLGRPEATRRT